MKNQPIKTTHELIERVMDNPDEAALVVSALHVLGNFLEGISKGATP